MKKKTQNIWVVKFGGSLLSDHTARRSFLKDAARIAKREPLVLVHGGGPEINAALDKMGIVSQWVNGRRVTDREAMGVVEGVLSGQVNKNLVGELTALGIRAVGLSGRDGRLLRAKPVRDLGRVGEPDKATPRLISILLEAGYLPVLSSVAFGSDYGALNVNADEAAAAVAVALKARRLVYLTDVPGVLDGNKKTIPVIRSVGIKKLIQEKVITGGMIPKVLSCQKALKKGVQEINIIDGRAGLLKRIGTRLLP
jgi:acetylglutamate kinase